MKIQFLALFVTAALVCSFLSVDAGLSAGNQPAGNINLVINELMASNTATFRDKQGEYDDWLEIYNAGSTSVNIAGMYLTDSLSEPAKWRIPDSNAAETTIPAHGYLLIWADGSTANSGLHASFKLDADGDEIGLYNRDGVTLIDSITFDEQFADISYGRSPEAGNLKQFMAAPTPGKANTKGYQGIADKPDFSRTRGFFDEPFSVSISTKTNGAIIYYTLDGSEPLDAGTGTLYKNPISITQTSCVRAIAVKPGWKTSQIVTNTYIFISDVVKQSPTGARPGPLWPSGNVNGQLIDYGMDPVVVNSTNYKDLMKNALLSIPTISLVTNLNNLFGATRGIYVNARNEGASWERPVSVELINPDGSKGFQINAGLRVRGGFSRTSSNPKHSFRLFFRSEYGKAKLEYPLFGDEGVEEFENLDLRTGQNFSWAYNGSTTHTEVREVFSRDLQRVMGQPYTRSRYYHLYINGQYWGLYQSQERAEASYAQSYLGGDKDDYDVVKADRSSSYSMVATDGNLDAYRRLYNAVRAGVRDNAAYFKVQGMNPDGTRNPNFERLLDVDNLIDFMIVEYYTGDRDGAASRYTNRVNNVAGIYNRKNPDGWKWFQHDSEHSLGASDHTTSQSVILPFTTAGAQFQYFNPQWLHEQLSSNVEYKMHFADHVYRYFFNDGVCTPKAAVDLFFSRAKEIEFAIIAESARWGYYKRTPPLTKDNAWLPEIFWIVNTYLPARTAVALEQFRTVGWYPNIEAPAFSHPEGSVPDESALEIKAPRGVIYYTLDGSDPHIPGSSWGILNSTILAAENAYKKVLVPTASVDNSWISSTSLSDPNWRSGCGSVGYKKDTGYESVIGIDTGEQMYGKQTSCYIHIPFTVSGDPNRFNSLVLNLRYDDGFIAYINGVEVQRSAFTGTPARNSAALENHQTDQFESFDISGHLKILNQGSNVLAIQGLNASASSSNFLISAELLAGQGSISPIGSTGLSPAAVRYSRPITITKSTQVKSRVLDGSTWSALNETILTLDN
jgi:hypothetical protein